MKFKLLRVVSLILIFCLALPYSVHSAAPAAPQADTVINFTILHTNDFHGNLEAAGSNPGAARVAHLINSVRTAVGADNVLTMDGGDIIQGSLISNLTQGLPTIDYYKTIGYDAVVLGNHEFDWGQAVLAQRAIQAATPETGKKTFPMLAANIVKKVGDSCAGWDLAELEDTNSGQSYTIEPYTILDVGSDPNKVQVGVIGVGSVETPFITIAEATQGLCFKDPAQSILYYYDEMKAAGADVMVVLSHNGFTDGGYGYGFTVYGDQTLASMLNAAGKPVNLIIGGHSHTNVTAAVMVGNTAVVQAHHSGRVVGRADFTYNATTGAISITWTRNAVSTTGPEDAVIKALVDGYVADPDYQALINEEIGWAQVDLMRNYNGDGMMGTFVQDAIFNQLNNDATPDNDVDMVFNNPGGIRSDWCDKEDPANPGTYIWSNAAADCSASGVWTHDPMKLTYGMLYSVLPFGNDTVVADMTGAEITDLLNQTATLFRGALSVAGVRYKFYRYADALPGPQPWAWGAYDIEVYDRALDAWLPIDAGRTYRIATNSFLAPAGQDGFIQFKYAKNISYWGDMLNLVIEWASRYTQTNPYKGPTGDGNLDERILREGTDSAGPIIPLTILHHNDSHGRLLPSGSSAGYTNLAALIRQERAHNPSRTLLLSAGDNIQGDSMMYFFKSAGLGYSADGSNLPADMQINPLIKAFNVMDYDAMVLGNHEFNFGKEVFSTLSDATFPILQANLQDDGRYGIAGVPVQPFVRRTVGSEAIKVSIIGIGNHRVPNYELPSNIIGLTFTNPITTASQYVDMLRDSSDVVIALTHIGFAPNPASIEVDDNVDTYMAENVSGIDAIIGGHSHSHPTDTRFLVPPFQFLPTLLGNPDGAPVIIGQANRHNTFLGQIVIGLRPKGGILTDESGILSNAYEVVSRAGRAIQVTTSIVEDPTVKAIIQPYADRLNTYNSTVIGETITPIDTMNAFTQETNGANLQADASVWKLSQEDIEVDFHLSGAMTNRRIADTATLATPFGLKISDMFTAMPFENSLVVMRMNGPQLKAVLERAYRNYYYYKYVPGYGGYSYYTTCMLGIDAGNKITYFDTYPELPNNHNVASLEINGRWVNFADANTYYNVSTVNYLAAGSCNFNDNGQTLWPLDQITEDTQYYVRDAVIEYIQAQTDPINPQIEGRLNIVEPIMTWFPLISR
ncbi:MAG: 5'-nucleotidase C-terminal domain-containing protein [Chloroflexota bacterium]